jgi:hypothetical protein
VRPQLETLIIHPQFRLHLLHSCLCFRLHLQGLAFLVRSIRVAQIDNHHSSGDVLIIPFLHLSRRRLKVILKATSQPYHPIIVKE